MSRYSMSFAMAMILIAGMCGSVLAQNPEWMVLTSENLGLPAEGVFALAVDPQGYIWMNCVEPRSYVEHGLAKFDGETCTVYTTSNSGLPYDLAFPFGFDDQGNTWIGTTDLDRIVERGGGVAKFDGQTWTVYNMDNSGLPSNNVWSGTIDLQGNVWVGTLRGVARFDGETWTVYDKNAMGMPSNLVSALAVDLKGNIWAGNYDGGGIARFDGEIWTAYTPANSGIVGDSILHIVFDPAGNMWVSSWGALVKFDGATWTTYTTDDSELPGGWGLAVDAQGMVWAGGGGILLYFDTTPGVGRFDGQTWTVYRPDNSEMPARKAYALVPDSHGNMWMGTEIGLVVYREGGVILPGTATTVSPASWGRLKALFR